MADERKLHPDKLVARLAVQDDDTLRPVPIDPARFDPSGRDWTPGQSGLEERMQPGDELWSWSTPKWTWQEMMGRAGFAIVRNGQPVDFTWTIMN